MNAASRWARWASGVAVWGLLAVACSSETSEAPPVAPPCPGCNVVLISADTLRADHLGAYGYARDTSPRIDRFASGAWVFLRATAPAPWTLPSHVSMLTGLYPTSHGVRTRDERVAEGTPTLAEILKAHGYRTGGFSGGGYVSERYGFRGFDRWDESGGIYGSNFHPMMKWLASAEEPFFLFYHDYLIHCPYDPPRRFDVFSDPSYAGIVETSPRKPAGEVCLHASQACSKRCAGYFSHIREHLGPDDLQHIVDKYDGEIRSVDWRVGWLLDLLETRGIRERSVVIFTSDHGEAFGRNGEIGHDGLYQEFLQVPLIVGIPGQEPRRLAVPATSMDILPTLLEALALPVPPGLDGRSLLAAVPRDRPVVSEQIQHAPTFAIRRQAQKLIWNAEADHREYFDLEADPGETRDLSGIGREGERELLTLLRSHLEGAPARPAPEPGAVGTTPEQEEQLRALGYVE